MLNSIIEANKKLCINADNDLYFNVSREISYSRDYASVLYKLIFSLWRLMLICQNRFRYFENEPQAYKYTFIMVLPVQIVVLLEKHALRSVYLLFIYYFYMKLGYFTAILFFEYNFLPSAVIHARYLHRQKWRDRAFYW